MTTCLVAFAVAFVVAIGATLGARAAARRLGIVDRPGEFRKLHQREVPLLGGVAVFAGFVVPVVVLLFGYENAVALMLREHFTEVLALIAGAASVVVMGVVDDVRGLPARWKLLGQTAAASVAFAGGFAITMVSNPVGRPLALGLLSFPVTLVWFLACMNAVNLLDGLDGLAAGVCLLAGITLFLVSLLFGQVLSMLLMACLSGAILGFLLFNFHPASIFLGDSGSTVLGFLLAALSLMAARKTETAVALVIPFIALGLPIFDTALAILRRWLRRLPISAADRQHVHHVLLAMGLTQRQAVLALYVACLVLSGAALLVTADRNEVTLLVLGSLAILAFVCVRLFGGMRFLDLWGRLTSEMERRHRSAEAKMAVERAIARMQASSNTQALWQAFCNGLEGLDLDGAILQLFMDGQAAPRPLTWPDRQPGEADRPLVPDETWSAHLNVRFNGHTFGQLDLHKSVSDGPLLAEAPELVEKLRAEMATHIERLSAVQMDGAPAARSGAA